MKSFAPIVVQKTSYTCGVACVLSMLKHFNIRYHNNIDLWNEATLKNLLKTTYEDGTYSGNIIEFFKTLGYKNTRYITPDERQHFLHLKKSDNLPNIIVEFQSCPRSVFGKAPTLDDACGHYVIPVQVDEPSNTIYYMDPAKNTYGMLELSEFNDRWVCSNKKCAIIILK